MSNVRPPMKPGVRVPYWLTVAAVLVCGAVLLTEAGGHVVMAARGRGQSTPVFDWKGGVGGIDRSGDPSHAYAMSEYNADRGRRVDLTVGDRLTLQLELLEWDYIEDGPLATVWQHAPEICNVAAGFKFLGREAPRVWDAGQRVEFDSTAFSSPGGQTVYMFKTAWMAGLGNIIFQASELSRIDRLLMALRHRAGAARVLQAAVTGASSSDEAWEVFEREVLRECKWRE